MVALHLGCRREDYQRLSPPSMGLWLDSRLPDLHYSNLTVSPICTYDMMSVRLGHVCSEVSRMGEEPSLFFLLMVVITTRVELLGH